MTHGYQPMGPGASGPGAPEPSWQNDPAWRTEPASSGS